MDRGSSTHSERWEVMGSKLLKLEIVYFCQMYSLLSSYEFQHFSIVFLQLFSAEVFQDVAERTVSISLSK
jgi:hypothetical protein